MADHYLIVPPVGLLEVIHADNPIDPEGTLRVREVEGQYVTLTHHGTSAHWFSSAVGTMNPRARRVFATVTDVHVIFTGPVLFTGIDEWQMGEIVGALSLRDTAGDGL